MSRATLSEVQLNTNIGFKRIGKIILKKNNKITLKLPILSAITPAIGGIIMDTIGVTADIIAVSSTFIPNSLICIVKYGYRTYMAANNKLHFEF